MIGKKSPAALFSDVGSSPAAKSVVFAACRGASLRPTFAN
jgi:hypothetical protein